MQLTHHSQWYERQTSVPQLMLTSLESGLTRDGLGTNAQTSWRDRSKSAAARTNWISLCRTSPGVRGDKDVSCG
jgi:hypothetical protein